MLSLGFDIGSSSIKCAVLDCETGRKIAAETYPTEEMLISSPRDGWAEQDPEMWWEYVRILTRKIVQSKNFHPGEIRSIGISYQMHGLVLVDARQRVLRPAIIWCDSRAVDIGNRAFDIVGQSFCLRHLLNSPGNFTASKLRWVKENEPDVFRSADKAMLPGDFIAMKLTGEVSTTVPGLSEAILWDYTTHDLSDEVLGEYEINRSLLPLIKPTFSIQGKLQRSVAEELGLRADTVVSYRAGDQPNNAFSLNVMNPGEIAATAGTSGVVYGVTDTVQCDTQSRVNAFAHVNYRTDQTRIGILLCINGTGILNSWLRKHVAAGATYDEMNAEASRSAIGSGGLSVLPFGNGSERVLENRNIGGHILGLDLNRHGKPHLIRAAHEGIAFSFKYGIDVMTSMGLNIRVLRAGNANMFLSPVFRETLANATGASIELYDTDGALGAARGAAVGAGMYATFEDAFRTLQKINNVQPDEALAGMTSDAYALWLSRLNGILQREGKRQ